MIYGIVTAACFLSLVQRMSLAAKCSRARANMINREQRLQAWCRVFFWGGGLGLLLSIVYPVKSEQWCMRDAAFLEPRGERDVRRGDLFPPISSRWGKEEEEVEEDGIAGITSHGGL